MSITDFKPYTYRCTKKAGWFSPATFEIYYEDQCVRWVEGFTDDDLEEMVFLLNAAYQLGYSDGTVQSDLLSRQGTKPCLQQSSSS